MVAKTFEVGDLVWAKMKSYPEWPGKIVDPPNNKERKGFHYVFFFGTLNYSWMKDETIKHHTEAQFENLSKRKLFGYEEAVEQIKKEAVNRPAKVPVKVNESAKDKESPKPTKVAKPKSKSPPKSTDEFKRPLSPKKPDASGKPAKKRKLSTETADKSPKKDSPPIKVKFDVSHKKKVEDGYNSLLNNVLTSMGQDDQPVVPKPVVVSKQGPCDASFHEESMLDDIPKYELGTTKVGFLGLGMMGRGLVKNLLRGGHNVTVWNRTLDKCDEFVALGAKKAYTVAEVASRCDIIFCCVSDPEAVRMIILGENGLLKGVENYNGHGNKGYVELTSVDADTSQEIGDAVCNAGLRYLEAPLIGSVEKAMKGMLIILGSGDRTLFNDCESCFHSMSKHAYYLSCDVGKSANMNIITSSFSGMMQAALSEVLALANSVHLSPADLLEIFELHGIISQPLQEKGQEIVNKMFDPTIFLKHQQKDLRLGLKLSEKSDQPMPIAAASNQMFIRAMGIGLSDYDSIGVYLGYKY